jgi:hypothetical protein
VTIRRGSKKIRRARLLVEQLRAFPLGEYFDEPDALDMAIVLAGDMVTARQPDPMPDRIYVGPEYCH